MSMNMRMNPEFQGYPGFYPMANQGNYIFNKIKVFPNQPNMSPIGRNVSYQYHIPHMDPLHMNNPYQMNHTNYPFPPMQMYSYPGSNPNMHYYNPINSINHQANPAKVSSTTNEARQDSNIKNIKK